MSVAVQIPEYLRDRVRAGAALLDRERPGWRREVKGDELEMADCTLCVLGQLYGHYLVGADRLELGLWSGQRKALGFYLTSADVTIPAFGGDERRAYHALNVAWREELIR